jgi:hypothetical protein
LGAVTGVIAAQTIITTGAIFAIGIGAALLVGPERKLTQISVAGLIPLILVPAPQAPATLAIATGLWALICGHRRTAAADRVSGFLMGATGLLRPDFGVYAVAAVLLTQRRTAIVLWATAAVLPAAALLLLVVPFPILVDQLVVFPLEIQRAYRTVPLPNPFAAQSAAGAATIIVLQYLPLMALVTLAAPAILRRPVAGRTYLSVLVFAILVQVQGIQRADLPHAAWAAAAAVTALAVTAARPLGGARLPTAAALAVAVLAALGSVRYGLDLVATASNEEAHAQNIKHAIDERAEPGDSIFVALPTNEATPVNSVLLYVLLERQPCSRYTLFNPGVTDLPAVQEEIVRELESAQCRWIVLSEVPRWTPDDNPLSGTPRSDVLDRFIRNGYRPIVRTDSMSLYERAQVGTASRHVPPYRFSGTR